MKAFKKSLSIMVLLLFAACGDDGVDVSLDETPIAEVEEPVVEEVPFRIVIASGDINHRGITSYALDGSDAWNILDLRSFEATPNGLAVGPGNNFLTSVDGADSILSVPYSNQPSFFYGSGLLNGSLYDMELGSVMNYYYVVETNNIEVFNSSGVRLASALIPRNLGLCNMTAPRNMHATEDGFLYVADYSANRIHKYDISNHVATCEASISVPGLLPYGVIRHSNGLLYISSFGDDAVYTLDEDTMTLTNIFQPGLTILRDPRGLAELPNGDVVVSSSIMDTIERIDSDGVRQGTEPFISDVFSLNITDIEVLQH
jgi:DNA-binding beta-propeller fold protein YncE